ncbi:MAG: sialidase family protein [Chthoniobacterales bacterium]
MRLSLAGICCAAALALADGQTTSPASASRLPNLDRRRLPAALQNVPLDRLSSGALLRLDLDGDLVETPAAREAHVHSREAPSGAARESSEVSLDRRVGANIRLGDDPAPLPEGMGAQAEPHIARAIGNPDFLLATFQEGRRTDGGAVDCGYAVSHDGGLSWRRALIPGLTTASGGTLLRATDPVAGIDLAGTAFLNTLGATNTQFTTGAVVVSRSTDGGNTFAPPVVVYQSPNSTQFPDKNWMAINNFATTATAGRVVVTYTLFTGTAPNGGAVMRSFSDDHGGTWSPPAQAAEGRQDAQGSQPVFLSDGKLAIVYWNFNNTLSFADDFIEVVVSDNGGNTFGPPRFVTNVDLYSESQIRNGGFLPAAVADRVGNLYIVYQALFAGTPKIMFTKSPDAGVSWSTPIPISDSGGTGVFNAALGASPDGQTLTAVFYDHRANPGSGTLVDMFLAQSFDGGATWQPNIRLTPVSTDASLAPLTSNGYMLGDYLGVVEATTRDVPAVPVWIDTRTGDPDPWVARVGIAPAFDFRSWQAAHLSLGQINEPALGQQAGDADGDGEDNLSEFQSGTDPNDPASVAHTSRQVNISTRTRVEGGEHVLIGGFIITGSEPKRVLARAIGPSLAQFGVADALPDPTLELVPESGPMIFNDDWQETDAEAIRVTGIPPRDSRESAIVQTLAPGRYTAIVRSKTGAPGIGLIELYDLDPAANSRFGNLSSRGLVAPGADNVMIGGVIVGPGTGVSGAGSARVALRGMGPSLAQSGIADALQDPELLVFDANANLVASNDNWRSSQEAELQTLGLAPGDEREAAFVTTLRRGNYTAIVRGKDGTTGVALVEAYYIP